MDRDIVKESRAWAKRVGADDYKWHGTDVLDGINKVEDLCDHAEAQERRIVELHKMPGRWDHTARLDGMYGFWEEVMPEVREYLRREAQ